MGQVILQALGNLFTVQNLIFANIGIFIGIIFGAIPGMNGNLAITVLLPFTFQMDTVPALLMLTDRKSTRLNSSHRSQSRMPSSA